ncbi:major facilitator superfamily domain-containing protein [Armillaria mellea]|nr:major facilitator superfamily domain-containing protein [Armillaria mellea]
MGWTLLTLCTTWVHNATHLYVIRFFVGLFESGYYPGLLFLIGSWYTKDELAKRSNIFQAATAGGTLLCGLIQGGIYSSLNGKGGYSGWRCCFAIDALISFPVAVGAFFMIPDLPTVIKPNWLFSKRDIEIGRARMLAAGREGPKPGSFNFPFFVNLLSEWHIWLFTAGYSLSLCHFGSKNPTYTVPQINYYPSGIWATQIVSALGFSWLSDTVLKGRRWPPLIFVTVWHLIDVAILAATPVYAKNRAPRWAFYYLSGLVNCTPGLFYAWCSEIAGASSEKRGIIMGTFNSVAYSFNAWLPLLLFKTTEQPQVLKGNISVVVAQILLIGVLLAILRLSKRDQRRKAKKAQDD